MKTCRCGCGGRVRCKDLAGSCYEWWLDHDRPDHVPQPGTGARMHGGGRGGPCAVQLRDALKIYLWQHMSRHRDAWLTAAELCRVIAERYTCDAAGGDYGRGATVKSCLAELSDAGEVERREVPHPRPAGAGPGRRTAVQAQYRWCGP